MQKTQNNEIILKKNKIGGLALPDLKTYCKATVISTMWQWHSGTEQNPEKNPYICGHLILTNTTRQFQEERQAS